MSRVVDFKHIGQRGNGDCGIASMAMFAGLEYDDVLQKFPRFSHSKGLTEHQIMGALAYHFDLHVARTDGFASTVPGILTVPSLLRVATLHFVVWTGSRILDPQTNGQSYQDIAPERLLGAVVSQIYSLDIAAEVVA